MGFRNFQILKKARGEIEGRLFKFKNKCLGSIHLLQGEHQVHPPDRWHVGWYLQVLSGTVLCNLPYRPLA